MPGHTKRHIEVEHVKVTHTWGNKDTWYGFIVKDGWNQDRIERVSRKYEDLPRFVHIGNVLEVLDEMGVDTRPVFDNEGMFFNGLWIPADELEGD
jgi:hypothetical protein